MNAAPGTRFFCRMFELAPEAKILCAKLEISADNVCVIRLSHREVATKRSWERPESIDVTDSVHPGSNFMGLEVTNTAETPNPAGGIARLDVAFADGTTESLVTDTLWRVSPENIGTPPCTTHISQPLFAELDIHNYPGGLREALLRNRTRTGPLLSQG